MATAGSTNVTDVEAALVSHGPLCGQRIIGRPGRTLALLGGITRTFGIGCRCRTIWAGMRRIGLVAGRALETILT
uniref:Uncharacterized protein n=1 Tax=Romanomermis culicivorax TaxID=13658 RepID=A0A915IVS4_ROMCU